MGLEVRCRIELDGETRDGKALLETEEIVLRGRGTVRLKKASAEVVGDALELKWDGHSASIHLGEAEAKKWLDRIRNPKSRLDKIGIKPGQRVTVLGVPDFEDELRAHGADVATRVRKESDAIFFGANSDADLEKLAKLKESLAPAGALWIIRPKGTKTITEASAMAAGKAAGLVDVKVVKFSETHTAEKFVIPRANRA
jgi:hypothetical protein